MRLAGDKYDGLQWQERHRVEDAIIPPEHIALDWMEIDARFQHLCCVATSGNTGTSSLHPDRFRHLLWILYPVLLDGLTLSPAHQDLRRIAEASSSFLAHAFSVIPKDSGVKRFLKSPNVHGWDVKRKLIWLGAHSFMFRLLFGRYMEDQAPHGRAVAHTDDFVCQECTRWSGLGVIDILAGVLDISDDDRKDLRAWYERHAAFPTTCLMRKTDWASSSIRTKVRRL